MTNRGPGDVYELDVTMGMLCTFALRVWLTRSAVSASTLGAITSRLIIGYRANGSGRPRNHANVRPGVGQGPRPERVQLTEHADNLPPVI